MTRAVFASGKKVIWLKNSKVPHIILIFDKITIEEIKKNRPSIEGSIPCLLKYLGDHIDVQKWDFIERNGKVALLIPKRYAILTLGRIESIYLLFNENG